MLTKINYFSDKIILTIYLNKQQLQNMLNSTTIYMLTHKIYLNPIIH
jgi:hypothetical protein